MPVSFRDLTAGEAEVAVTYNGHVITLTYDPSRVTENAVREVAQEMRAMIRTIQRERRAQEHLTDEDGQPLDADLQALERQLAQFDDSLHSSAVVNALLARFIVKWDLTDDDGVTMFPLTPERLGELPFAFRQQCVSALYGENRMGEANGTLSRKPSPATTSSRRHAGSRH